MEYLTDPAQLCGAEANQAERIAEEVTNTAGGVDGRMSALAVEASKSNAQEGTTAYHRPTDVEGVKTILEFSTNGQVGLKTRRIQVTLRSMQLHS